MLTVYISTSMTSFGTDTFGEGVSTNLYFSGCSRVPKCKGCHNPLLWERDERSMRDIQYWKDQVKRNITLIDSVVFLGGEPLDQEDAALELSRFSRSLGLKTWLYTGREYEDLSKEVKEEFDVIVSGEFVEELLSTETAIPASTNQVLTRRNKRVENDADSR